MLAYKPTLFPHFSKLHNIFYGELYPEVKLLGWSFILDYIASNQT